MDGRELPARRDQTRDLRSALAAWQRTHPGATLLEIEQEVDRQLAGLRTEVVTEVVAAAEAAMIRPTCPRCGVAMERAGRRSRRLTAPHHEVVEVTGTRYRCPACGAGLSPPR